MRGLFLSNLFPSVAKPNCGSFSVRQLQACGSAVDFQVMVPTPWTEYRRFRRELWRSNNDFDATYFPYFYTPGVLRATYGARIHKATKKLYPQIREFAPEFVLGSFVYPDGYAAFRVAQDLRLPFAVQALGSDIKVHGRNANRNLKIRETLAHADRVFSVSKDLAADMTSYGAGAMPVIVNYNGVDQEIFCIRDSRQCRERIGVSAHADKTILFVGNLIESKGVFELVEAIKALRANGESVQLIIIGTGSAKKQLVDHVARADLTRHVHFAGYVPNSDLADWYCAADIFCLPSYSEGVPNVIMEAIACGRPVVASRVGGIPEIVGNDNGLLIEPRSSKSLTSGLSAALHTQWNPQLIRQSVADYTWERYGDCLVKQLRTLTSGKDA